jgi:hypothetical protein
VRLNDQDLARLHVDENDMVNHVEIPPGGVL